MISSELPTLIAIYHAEQMIEQRRKDGEDLPTFGSDDWLIEPNYRAMMLSIIQRHLVPDESLLRNYISYRKSGDKKLRLMAQVAMVHGTQCFFAGRGKGECSADVDLDRIVPGSRGGEYTLENCQIICSHHNRERSDRVIEEYLRS